MTKKPTHLTKLLKKEDMPANLDNYLPFLVLSGGWGGRKMETLGKGMLIETKTIIMDSDISCRGDDRNKTETG